MDITIRSARLFDIDEIMNIENECFTSDAWSEKSFIYAIRNEEGGYINLVAELDGEVCGYLSGHVVVSEGEIDSIAVDGRFRRNGIAKKLMTEFEELSRARRFYLEVRASNTAARALYEGMGYEGFRVRRGYYDNPKEDAILMSKG